MERDGSEARFLMWASRERLGRRGSGTKLKVYLSSEDLVSWEMDPTLVTFGSPEGLLQKTGLWGWAHPGCLRLLPLRIPSAFLC